MNSAIAIRNVSKRFKNVVAVDDLDLTVPSGSLLCWALLRAQRVGQDDHAQNDHAHSAPG